MNINDSYNVYVKNVFNHDLPNPLIKIFISYVAMNNKEMYEINQHS